MTHGHSLEQTIEATHRALDERMAAATAPHRDLTRPRETYADTDGFLASASRHLAANTTSRWASVCGSRASASR